MKAGHAREAKRPLLCVDCRYHRQWDWEDTGTCLRPVTIPFDYEYGETERPLGAPARYERSGRAGGEGGCGLQGRHWVQRTS